MKRSLFALSVLLLAGPLFAQQSAPDMSLIRSDFFKLPEGMNFGEVPGRGVNSKGHIFVSAGRTAPRVRVRSDGGPMLEFGPKGEFIREVGKNLTAGVRAHRSIDKGRHIWAVDKGSDMIIVQFNQAGRVMMVLRTPAGIGRWRRPHPHPNPRCRRRTAASASRPMSPGTRRATSNITDGYVNSRFRQIRQDGDWVKSWGDPGTGPGQFRPPHAIREIDKNDNVYVGDRGNQRIRSSHRRQSSLRMFKIEIPPALEPRRSTDHKAPREHDTASARRMPSVSRQGRTR